MIRRDIRKAHQTGAMSYAKVEETHYGSVTVRLGGNGNGARLSNLPAIGTNINVGDVVVVDYASGVPPKVRQITPIYSPDESTLALAQQADPKTAEDSRDPSGNYVLVIYGTDAQSIGTGETTIQFDTEKYDTGALYDPGHTGYITITDPGYYFFIAHICINGFPGRPQVTYASYGYNADDASQRRIGEMNNQWCKLFLKSTGTAGIFGFGIGYNTGYDEVVVEAIGFLVAAEGDQISVIAQGSMAGLQSVVGASGLHPRLMGHRMSRDGRWANAGGGGIDDGGGDQGGPTIDDTDIEISGNQGYLHVSDTSGAYARAIAQASDWTDEEVTFTIKFSDIDASADFKIWLRSSRDWFAVDRPTTGYEMSISNTGGWFIAAINSGVRTLLTSFNMGPTLLTHNVKFYAKGTSIKAKMWQTGGTEPGWQVDITNGLVTTAGAMQLGFYRNAGEHKVYIDNIDLHGV